MQKIATRTFIYSSIAFGIAGLCLALFGGQNDNDIINQVLMRVIMSCVFIILPSFALSLAGKYLNGKS
jgi:ribose/xylose/arabinose/galactoside ABC-type transport system permease subunit